VPQQ